MTSKILYLTHTHQTAESIRRRYPRELVDAAQMGSVMGRRGDVVVIEPLLPGACGRERSSYLEKLEHARTKVADPATPIIVGEVL
jgi:hypothetical protein